MGPNSILSSRGILIGNRKVETSPTFPHLSSVPSFSSYIQKGWSREIEQKKSKADVSRSKLEPRLVFAELPLTILFVRIFEFYLERLSL